MKFVRCWNMDMLGYHNISYLINASIYLVKGGRLGLMPGVLFHSWRPSFLHTGVIFLDFCVPYAVGWFMGPPWQFALYKTPPARPNLGFTIYHLSLFPWHSFEILTSILGTSHMLHDVQNIVEVLVLRRKAWHTELSSSHQFALPDVHNIWCCSCSRFGT